MDSTLRERCVHMLMAFKRMKPSIGIESELSMGEFMALHKISAMHVRAEKEAAEDFELSVSNIQGELHVSKPAVSLILNSLEHKGLVRREIGREDRRRVAVRLTPDGDGMLLTLRKSADMMLDLIIERFGEEEMRDFLDRGDRLLQISREVRESIEKGEMKIATDD